MLINTEQKIYKLDNSYLTQDEKVIVESWFQLPGGVMEYVFWIMAIISISFPISLIYIFSITIIINIFTGILNWYFYNKKFTTTIGLSLFHPWVTSIVGICVGIYLFLNGALLLAIVSIFVGIFGFLFLTPHIILYAFLSQKYNMHPKYVFAKKQLGHIFPFEK